jgi:hypothetical protein
LASRRQADRQAGVERERIQAELDRLRLEQEQPHFQHRQAVYHDLLDVMSRWTNMVLPAAPVTQEQMLQWFHDAEHCFNAVGLFGSTEAFEASEKLKAAVEDGIRAFVADSWIDSPAERAFNEAFDGAVRAMRKDTAPDRQ